MNNKTLSLPTIDEFKAALPFQGRLMGLDVGDKTIGVAISDPMRLIASPFETLKRKGWGPDSETLLKIIHQKECVGVVMGLPANKEGGIGAQAEKVLLFYNHLKTVLTIPLTLWDERFSTQAASRILHEAHLSHHQQAVYIDKIAAAYILQGVLDRLSFLI